MDNLILSQIPISELLDQVKQAVREEMAAFSTNTAEPNNDRPITTKQLCEYLGITEPTVIRWKKKGKIPFLQIGTAVRFNLKDVLKALGK